MSKSDYIDYIVYDLLSGVDGLTCRAMFGAYGIYRDDVMFAIVDEDQLYFKVDDSNRADYVRKYSQPITYQSRGKSVTLPYWEVPADVMDDRDAIRQWAQKSYEISKGQKNPKPIKTRRRYGIKSK